MSQMRLGGDPGDSKPGRQESPDVSAGGETQPLAGCRRRRDCALCFRGEPVPEVGTQPRGGSSPGTRSHAAEKTQCCQTRVRAPGVTGLGLLSGEVCAGDAGRYRSTRYPHTSAVYAVSLQERRAFQTCLRSRNTDILSFPRKVTPRSYPFTKPLTLIGKGVCGWGWGWSWA